MDKRKAIVLSINLCSSEFVHSDSEESQKLQGRLKEMNDRWERLTSSLDDWRNSLQDALIQCQASRLSIINIKKHAEQHNCKDNIINIIFVL